MSRPGKDPTFNELKKWPNKPHRVRLSELPHGAGRVIGMVEQRVRSTSAFVKWDLGSSNTREDSYKSP